MTTKPIPQEPRPFRVTVPGHTPEPVEVWAKSGLEAVLTVLAPLGLRYADVRFTVTEPEEL